MRTLLLLASLLFAACSSVPADRAAADSSRSVGDLRGAAKERPEPAQGPDRELAERLKALVASYAKPDTAGLAIGLVRYGGLVGACYEGLADLEHRVPVTSRTRFHIASVSKQFTGYAVRLLIARGEIALTDRVGEHLPDVPPCVAAVTVDQLLHHTSGLRQTLRLQAVAGRRARRVLTQAAALDLIRSHRELNFEPGSEYGYSNSNYIVLATIIESVTGERFADWMQDEVFAPLGLVHTLVVDSYYEIVPDRARSYSREGDGFRNDSGQLWAIYGGRGVYTTLEDLARWVAFLMDPPPEAAAVVEAMQKPGTLVEGTALQYASGLEVGEYRGLRRFGHGGTGDGMEAYVLSYPTIGVGVVLLENAPLAPSFEVGRLAGDILLDGIDGVPSNTNVRAMPAEDSSPAPLSEDLRRRVVGRFLVLDEKADYAPGCLRIEREGDGLVLVGSDGDRLPLAAAGPERLVGVGIPVQFELPDGGAVVESMTFRIPGRELPVRRLDAEREAMALRPADHAGRYHSPESDTEFEVASETGGLVFRHPVHGDIVLEHVHGDTFDTHRNAIRWIHFERDEEGTVRGFRLTNDNQRVRRLWFERIADAGASAPEVGR